MKTVLYDNKRFWQVTECSAIRHHLKEQQLEVLTWNTDGEVQYRSRRAPAKLYEEIKRNFEKEGWA